MDKRQAIKIMTKSAKLYKENLENQDILFLYGIPKEINSQIQKNNRELSNMKSFQVSFYGFNFLHLTGVKLNNEYISSPVLFYEKCLNNRIIESEFKFDTTGCTKQKLEILEDMMLLKKKANMIGDFVDYGTKLYTEKIAGNTCGCIGFVESNDLKVNVPNTLLKKDVRDCVKKPAFKIYFVLSKKFKEKKYSIIEKKDKSINIENYTFLYEIENLLEREKFN